MAPVVIWPALFQASAEPAASSHATTSRMSGGSLRMNRGDRTSREVSMRQVCARKKTQNGPGAKAPGPPLIVCVKRALARTAALFLLHHHVARRVAGLHAEEHFV